MKYSLRKSFSSRRRKEIPDDDHVYPRIDANACSNSNSNLVKPVKSKFFLRRQHRSSSPPPTSQSSDQIKSKVFEPRHDGQSDDDDDESFSSSRNPPTRPLDRLTYQLRKSFRRSLPRQRSRLESTNSNKRLIFKKNEENQTQIPILPPTISTGLTSPLTIDQRKTAPLTSAQNSPSTSLPTEQNFNRSFRTRFSFLRKKRPENQHTENSNPKITLTQRFNSLRRSFHLGNRHSSNKGQRHLLSNE